MSAYVTRELILLACSIWQGAVLGFWYDLIKTARKLIRHSHAAVSAEDLCYWIAAALYLFVRIYGENSGILRGYLFGGILGGAALSLSPIKYPSPQGDFVLQLELTQPYP